MARRTTGSAKKGFERLPARRCNSEQLDEADAPEAGGERRAAGVRFPLQRRQRRVIELAASRAWRVVSEEGMIWNTIESR